MSGGNVDAKLCRQFADQMRAQDFYGVAAQLTAAADLAECNAPRSAAGQALDPDADLTTEQLDGMEMWDRDVMLDERHRVVGAMLVRRAVGEIRRRRAQKTLTEERVREVVRDAIGDEMRLVPAAERPALYDSIAIRAATKLAGAVVVRTDQDELVRDLVKQIAVDVLPAADESIDHADAIADRAAKELAGAVVGLSAEEREMLDAFRADPSLLSIARNRLLGGAK